MADNTNKQKLYDVIVSEGLYTKSYDDFNSQYSNPEAKTKLYNVLKDRGLYSKSAADFENKYFSASPVVEKKNPIQSQKPIIKPATASPSVSKTTKPSLGLGQQVITGPSASFSAAPTKAIVQPKAAPQESVSVTPTMQSQGQLLMAQPKPKTAEDVLAAEKQRRDVTSPTFAAEQALKPKQPKPKVGALEDIGNTFKSSMAALTSGIAGLPNMAERAAFMMLTKTLGLDEEYNALPVQKKKELDSAMSKMVSGVSLSPTVGIGNTSPELSRETQEFFIKKSNEFLDKTNKSDKYLNERVADFYKKPSVDKAADLAIEIPKLFAGSLPYMINPALGAISSASQTYAEDLEESGGKLGWGQLLNAGVTGVTEYYIERLTNNILNRSVADAVGVKRAAADFAKGFIKSVLKDVGLEAGGEAVTELTQSLSDDITNGREIDWVKTANKALDAGIGGFGMAASMRATGAGLGYLAKKVMPKSDKDIVDRNTRAIMDLNTKKGPDNSPAVNSVIDSKINELNKANIDIINNSVNTVKSLSDDQLKEIVRIDSELDNIYAKREPIAQDPNLTDEEKQSLLDHLRSQAETLIQQKDAIQKQTTSEVPVQPEAGTSQQVAEGESQAEPQGTTQEGQEKQKQLENNVEEINSKIKALRSEDGSIPEDKINEFNQLRTELLNAKKATQRGNTNNPVAIKRFKEGVDKSTSDPEQLSKNEREDAADIIEQLIQNSKTAEEALAKIQKLGYVFNLTDIQLLNTYLNDRFNSDAPQIGNNKDSFQSWVNGETDTKSQGQEVETITAEIPKQDLPKVMDLVARIEKGEQPTSHEDLQTQQNYHKEVEALLKVRAADMGTLPEVTVDVTKPVKFTEQEMPEISADQIDWEASKMGNIYDAIDSFGGINDITVVDVRGKNAQGQYEGKVRVTGQDTSREGVVVFKDPTAPYKPRMARQRKVSTEVAAAEKILSDNGVYPSFKNVEAIVELSKSKPGNVTQEDIQGVVKVYNKKAKAIANAFNKKPENENIQNKAAGTKVAAEETTKGAQPVTEQPSEEPKQIKVADAETIAKEMQTTFGLNKTQSKAAAVVIDKIANTIAKRAGTTKSKIMDAIVFKKGDINELSDQALFQKAERIKASKEDVDNAIKEVRALGQKSPFDNDTLMPNGTAVDIRNWEGALWISSIYTSPEARGKGAATETMATILEIANKNNVPVRLEASPFGVQKGLTKNQLINWYKSLGFKDVGYGELQKAPSPISKEVLNEGQEIKIEPVAKVKVTEKPKLPEGAKLVKPEYFFLDGEYDVVFNGKTIGNIYYDRSSKNWKDPHFDRTKETPWSFKWIYGEILGETKEEAVAELIKRHKQFPEGVKPKGDVLFQKAYHGGASKFNKFSTGKIGSGTNARFGGWGLYFTLDKARANTYADKLKNDDIEIGDFKISKSDYRYNELKNILEKTNSVIGITKELLKLSEINRQKSIKALNDEFDGKYKEYEDAYEKASLNRLNGIDVENSQKTIKDFEDRYKYAENNLYGHYSNEAYEYRKLARKVLSEGAKINNLPAYTYEVSIADDLNLLDFDNKISEDNYNKILNQALKENSKFIPEIIKNKDKSGRNFYFNVSQDTDVYDNDEELSLLMLRSGIDGNIMRSEGTQDIILFDDNAVEISNVIQFQQSKQGGTAQGAMQLANDGRTIIYALTDPNVSTPLHEMAHVYESYLTEDERKTVLDWAGKKDWETSVSEKFARGFEKYLAEGKAPNKELTKIFESFKKWLLDIYNGIVGSEIDIQLNDDMRKIYDIMLSEGEDVGIKELPGYDRMMGEVKGIVDKSFKRGVSYMQTMDNTIKYMEKSRVYEDASDIQREAMVREVRKMFKQKEKKAPTAQKILGQESTKTTITIDESKELNKRLKALEAAEQTGRKIGYKEGLKESEQARKDILDYVKSLKVNNKISGVQFKAIVNALKANLLNPVIRKRVQERIDKIIKKANYADQLSRSNKLRTAIKKAAKSKTLAANIAVMAKKFAKVNPNNVDNLDEYIDMANLVYNSIGKPIRTIAEEAMVNEYSDTKIKEAREAETKGLEDLYNSLVEQGLIPKNLSLAELQEYILAEEQNKKIEESKQREKEKRDVLNKVFDALKDMSNIILSEGYNPFTGEDVTLSAEDRQLLKDFTSMDLNKMPIASAYRAQEALMNYIVNGKKFGMRGILARYQGNKNAEIAEQKGLKAADFRWAVGGSWWGSRKWAKEVESIPGLFTWLFRGRNRGREVMKLMGLDQFMSGAAKAKLVRVRTENEYIAKFLKKKPNGKRFNNINNTYERLVYAYLSRSVDGSPEEKQAEFDRRKRILAQNVQAMAQSRNKELISEGEVLSRELNKAKDAKNSAELKSKFDPINIEAVEFISGKFDEYFDQVDEVAEGIYNLILNKDELYTPDMMRDIKEKAVDVAEMKNSVDIPFDLLNKQPVGTMLENKRIQNLPGYNVEDKDASKVTKILKLDFDSSAFNAFEKSLMDTYTAEAVQKYSAFVKSESFPKLFDNVNDETAFKEIVNYYINNERGKVGYTSDWKAVHNFSNRLKNMSTYRALGSATAFLKQAASAIVNTTLNLSDDPYALSQVGRALTDPEIGDFINRSEAEINLRGAEATADIKSAEKLIRESKYQTINDALDVFDKAGRLQMKSLSLGDVPMARASWFGYYVHALKKQGKPYKNVDWSTAKLDKDAAFYANTEVSINQNASMPSTLGQLFSSKNPLTRLTATYLFPFTSFLFNAKSRLKTDITVLTSKLATTEDKQSAARSIAATLAEMPAYIAISTAINYALVSAANAFLGYDEDEEDEKLRLKRYAELALTRIITDLISPLPNIGDVTTVAAFNAILEKVQEDPEMEEEDKKDIIKLFESKPDNMAQAMAELLLQPIASTGRRIADIYTTIDMATGDSYINDKGKEIEFTDEDKRMLQIAAAMQVMGSLNLLPSEGESLAKKIVRAVEKRNKEEGNY